MCPEQVSGYNSPSLVFSTCGLSKLRITRIYYQGSITTGEILTLPANTSHHLIRVLRCRTNTAVIVFNGDGGEYTAILLNDDPRAATIRIQSFDNTIRESTLRIILIQGVSRGEHMDTTIQKATELGAAEIIPVICERSSNIKKHRISKKLERWNQIAISASEQSGRNLLPILHEVSMLDEVINHVAGAYRLVLDPTAAYGIKSIAQITGPVCILCGPEGGLSEQEIAATSKAGYTRITFGPRVLRTETAGPAFISALQVLWGDMG